MMFGGIKEYTNNTGFVIFFSKQETPLLRSETEKEEKKIFRLNLFNNKTTNHLLTVEE